MWLLILPLRWAAVPTVALHWTEQVERQRANPPQIHKNPQIHS